MARRALALWMNVAVGLLGIIVGAGNIMRAFYGGPRTRSLVVGIACLVLAAIWLLRVYLVNRSRT